MIMTTNMIMQIMILIGCNDIYLYAHCNKMPNDGENIGATDIKVESNAYDEIGTDDNDIYQCNIDNTNG